MSRLDSELTKTKEAMNRLLRERSAGHESTDSLKLSSELELTKSQLVFEVSAKAALEEELNSLKQSLVVEGKSKTGSSELKEKVVSLEGEVRHLKTELVEKESEAKRQTQIHSRTISDLQAKLSREREQREELRQSAPTAGASPQTSEASTSADIARLTAELHEKDKHINDLVMKLQSLEKTAAEVVKISRHSKKQSGTIAQLKEELQWTQV